ncbi:MAG: CinA family protein [Betaproteobacteria bacterium]|nr:CinA family protein [Betaproteobacteria bacterium]
MTTDTIETLAEDMGAQLVTRGWKLVTVESCTGGWVAQATTAIAGSSAWFDRGFVTYSNEAKQELVGVTLATLVSHGAVSEATAREMATGGLSRSSGDIAVSITGVAGPTGGTPAKPVGMVCFAWATKNGVVSATHHFKGDREGVRWRAVECAMQGVRDAAAKIGSIG